MSKSIQQEDLPTRVAVLEHSVGEVRTDVSSLRSETAAGFNRVQAGIDSLVKSGAGQKTNWFAVMGFVAAAIGAISAVFSLAEWRVGVATAPLVGLPQQVLEMRIRIERDRAVQDYKERAARQ